MKEKDNIVNLFDRLKDDFDVETPELGHKNRFLERLEQQQQQETKGSSKPVVLFTWWKQIAAACVILLSLGIFIGSNIGTGENSEVTFSPEVEKSQLYFASLIEKELEKVKAAEDEDTKEIIQDALLQLERLEKDYTNLKNQLIERGDDKRILHAMVTNFQLRIDLLEGVLTQIDEIKLFKNENTII